MFKHIKNPGATQRGSALIVALVFLLVMTLIGTTAMQGTTQQERMAGNYLDRMMAFQAAEGALIHAKDEERQPPPLIPNSLANPPGQQLNAWWEPTTPPLPCPLTGANLNTPQPCSVQGYPDLSSPPRYVIEKLSGISQSGGIMCRYTARATGGSGSAEVMLEAITECE